MAAERLYFCEENDDEQRYRPGLRAIEELGLRSPLRELGLVKSDARRMAKVLGLPNWNHPATTCLATRFPYGATLTDSELSKVEKLEGFLKEMDLEGFRSGSFDL